MWDVDAAGGADPAADPAGAPPPETDGVEKERRNSVTSLKAMWNVGDGGAEGETAGDPGPSKFSLKIPAHNYRPKISTEFFHRIFQPEISVEKFGRNFRSKFSVEILGSKFWGRNFGMKFWVEIWGRNLGSKFWGRNFGSKF